ncbi:MAG: SpoIID/LytB domain-containing protein [Dorea sp.]
MIQKVKYIGSYLTIIILLPYIITVFMSGPSISTSAQVEDTFVKVKMERAGVENSESFLTNVEDTDRDNAIDGESSSAIVKMSIEDYCIGILAKEIPVEYESEALKAQAVLVRTNIYRKISQNGSNTVLEEEFWTREQMEEAWGVTKYTKNYNKLKEAWNATNEQVLTYEEQLAFVSFFRLSNGSTRDGEEVLGEEYPYLKIVECPLDIEAVEQLQTTTIDEMDAEVTACDTAGYVLNVRVGDENVSGEEFRKNYHLASSCFTLQKYEGKLRITTRGVGHGIGMSQFTADKMAEDGKSYTEILEYFFEGTELKEVADIVINDV